MFLTVSYTTVSVPPPCGKCGGRSRGSIARVCTDYTPTRPYTCSMDLQFHFRRLRHAASHECQLQEVRFYGRGMQRLRPESAENPGGESPRRQGAQNVINDSRFKWLDRKFRQQNGSLLTVHFELAQLSSVVDGLVSYELVTANDNPGRDPVAWTLAARKSADGWLPWVVLDRRQDVTPPRARLSSYAMLWLPLRANPSLLSPFEQGRSSSNPPPLTSPPLLRPLLQYQHRERNASRVGCASHDARCEAFCKPALAKHPDRAVHHCSMCRCSACEYCSNSAGASNSPRSDLILTRAGNGPLNVATSTLSPDPLRTPSMVAAWYVWAAKLAIVCNRRSTRCVRGRCRFQRTDQKGSSTRQTPPRVLVLGDSLLAPPSTYGYVGTGGDSSSACSPVTNTLSSNFEVEVENRAFGGLPLNGITSLYTAAMTASRSISGGHSVWTHIVLSGGINDIPLNATAAFDVGHILGPGRSTARQESGMLAVLVHSMLRDGIERVVIVGYPEGEGLGPGKPRHRAIAELRARIMRFATSHAPRVAFVDGSSLFGPYPKDKSMFGSDRSHPSESGGAVLGEAIGRVLLDIPALKQL